jgi:hypothetical protein
VNDTADNASIVFARRACLVRWQMRLEGLGKLSPSLNGLFFDLIACRTPRPRVYCHR